MTSRLRHRLRCPYCGSNFTPTAERDCCVSCHRIGVMSVNPQWDKHYTDAVADVLAENYGRFVPHLAQRLGGTSEDVKYAVRLLRRWGWQIDGDQQKGYRFHGWTRWEIAPTDSEEGGTD